MQGKIDAKSESTKALKINGEWYNAVAVEKYMGMLNKGDNVEFKANDRHQLQFIKKVGVAPQQDGNGNKKDLRITRMAVLNTAVEFNKTTNLAKTTEELIGLAKDFEKWVLEA